MKAPGTGELASNKKETQDQSGPLALRLRCGIVEPLKSEDDAYKAEASCYIIGCENCQYAPKDGSRPVVADMKRGIAIWAAHKRAAISKGERDEEINQIAGALNYLKRLAENPITVPEKRSRKK